MKYAIINKKTKEFVRNSFDSETGQHTTTTKSFYKRAERKLVEKHLEKAQYFIRYADLEIVEIKG